MYLELVSNSYNVSGLLLCSFTRKKIYQHNSSEFKEGELTEYLKNI